MGLMQSKYKVNEAVSVINTQYKSKHIEGIVIFTQKEDYVHITPTEKKNETKLTLFFDNVIAPLQA